MSIFRTIIARVLPPMVKKLMPSSYYDEIYVKDFIAHADFKMLSLSKTISCFRMGFLPFEYLWFGLDKNDFRNYLPTRSNYQKRRINGAYNAILSNKLIFEMHLKAILSGAKGIRVAESIGYLEKGQIISLSRELHSRDVNSLLEIMGESDLILKLISGDGGVGLICLSKKENAFYINDRLTSLDELTEQLNRLDNYLIQKRIRQESIAGTIFPGSVNTMRIGTMIDPDTGQPFIAYAVHRFGTSKTGFVDNVGQGGITSKIDIDTGRLSMAHQYSKDGKMEVFVRHPVTSVMIFNQEIRGWQDIKSRIIDMAGRMPYLKYVGWDFVLSNDELIVLEGNVAPGLGLVQMYDPMNSFPQAWNFFRHHGYV